MKNVTLDEGGRLFVGKAEVATPIPPEEDIEFLDAWEVEHDPVDNMLGRGRGRKRG
jgi:hypothetical protein